MSPPAVFMLVGLQGSGKTTTTAKIALRVKERERKKALMASLDVRRPAAQQQLAVLGVQADVSTLDIVPGEPPVAIAKRAVQTAALEGFDLVLLDTAGRLAIDEELMAEVAAVRDAVSPHETLLVADSMTGQDAVTVARNFNERVGLTGIVLTRVDGDARGGAALSMKAVTGCPIKLLGTGEKLDALEAFHPDRIASRILGMGDVVSLVEKAAETIEEEEAEKLAKKIQKGKFDLDDLASQLSSCRRWAALQPDGHAARHAEDPEADEGREGRRRHGQAPAGDPLLHDAQGTQAARDHQGEPQAAHRRRLRHHGAGGQQAHEAVPGGQPHDEADDQDGQKGPHAPRPARHAARGRYGRWRFRRRRFRGRLLTTGP